MAWNVGEGRGGGGTRNEDERREEEKKCKDDKEAGGWGTGERRGTEEQGRKDEHRGRGKDEEPCPLHLYFSSLRCRWTTDLECVLELPRQGLSADHGVGRVLLERCKSRGIEEMVNPVCCTCVSSLWSRSRLRLRPGRRGTKEITNPVRCTCMPSRWSGSRLRPGHHPHVVSLVGRVLPHLPPCSARRYSPSRTDGPARGGGGGESGTKETNPGGRSSSAGCWGVGALVCVCVCVCLGWEIAIGETVILLTLSLSIAIETPTKGRGGCSRMTVSPTASGRGGRAKSGESGESCVRVGDQAATRMNGH